MRILTVNGSAISTGPFCCEARLEPAGGASLVMDYGI
jgi:hypothetical protein